MKILIETTGKFQLIDYGNGGTVIRHSRPTVSTESQFISARAAVGQIRVIGNVNDEATDAEFAKYWQETKGDKELAVSSFMASFEPVAPVEEKKPAKKGRKGKKTEAEAEAEAEVDVDAELQRMIDEDAARASKE